MQTDKRAQTAIGMEMRGSVNPRGKILFLMRHFLWEAFQFCFFCFLFFPPPATSSRKNSLTHRYRVGKTRKGRLVMTEEPLSFCWARVTFEEKQTCWRLFAPPGNHLEKRTDIRSNRDFSFFNVEQEASDLAICAGTLQSIKAP